MKYSQILTQALALLGEDVSGDYSADYSDRAPYLLALICENLSLTDSKIRSARGYAPNEVVINGAVDPEDEFPLSEELSSAAAHYLASLLIFDTDAAKSDALYERYCALCDSVIVALPFTSSPTVDKYPV